MLLFVNDLTVMDFSYLCEDRGIVGESWIVDIVLDGDLNDESMVLDFGLVKKQIKRLIDDYVDHKLLVPLDNKLTTSEHIDGMVLVDFQRPNGKSIHLNCPEEAYAFLYSDQINMDSVSEYLHIVIKNELPTNIQGLEISLRQEPINSAYYHYSHGLKKHDGNCQRIVHGHRSKIIIEQDGKRAHQLETEWSQRWRDIYLGSSEDKIAPDSLNLSEIAKSLGSQQHIGFGYEALQGKFEMLMPDSECEIIDTDSTVECLAQYIADQLKGQHPDSCFKVFAFEGVGKGAIAFSK